jgi:predicted NBD/HSP70 family sugar kinase
VRRAERAERYGCFANAPLCVLILRFIFLATTPKKHWHQVDVVGPFKAAFKGVPIAFDTDVNAPALAEAKYGAKNG